jgi:hypothetical protein
MPLFTNMLPYVEVWPHGVLTSVLHGDEYSALSPGKFRVLVDWLGPTAGMETVEVTKIYCSRWESHIVSPTQSPITMLTELRGRF